MFIVQRAALVLLGAVVAMLVPRPVSAAPGEREETAASAIEIG